MQRENLFTLYLFNLQFVGSPEVNLPLVEEHLHGSLDHVVLTPEVKAAGVHEAGQFPKQFLVPATMSES